MKKNIIMPAAYILALSLVMTSCSQAVTEESAASLTEGSATETTVEPFAPIQITEDYSGPILGIENWHIEDSAYYHLFINDDTGEAFASCTGNNQYYLADLNNDGEPELVVVERWGIPNNTYSMVFKLEDGVISSASPCEGSEYAGPCYYPELAAACGLTIDGSDYGNYSDTFDPERNMIIVTDSSTGTEYEFTWEYMVFFTQEEKDAVIAELTGEINAEPAEPFAPIEITEDYDGAIFGVENWHMEYEDLSWGSIAAINVYLVNDDTGNQFIAYGGRQDDLCAYLADLNGDGEPEVVCNSSWGSESDFRNHTCIFRSNDGHIDIAFPSYGDLEHSSFLDTYPDVAAALGLDINTGNCADYSDVYDPETNSIILTDSADGSEYEIRYEWLQFTQYLTEESGDAGEVPSDDIDIVYETAEPVITDISYTEKEIAFYRDGLQIEGKLYLPEGDGPFPVIVLSCGLMQPYEDYEADAQVFADNGYAAVVFSFLDYSDPDGEQPSDFGQVFLSETSDLYAVMDSLGSLPKVDTSNVYLWGHSFGGLVAAFAGCDRSSEVRGLLLVEPSIVMGESLAVTYEDRTSETLRIYDLLSGCDLDTVIYMGTHDGFGDDPSSFDEVLAVMPSCELVIIDGADHFFEGEYGVLMAEDACEKIASWNE